MVSEHLPKGWQESKKFTNSKKLIEEDSRRFDEMIDGVLISISANPTNFDFVDQSKKLQVCKARVVTNDGALKPTAIFFIDFEDTVYLVDIIEIPNES